jgi:tRNA A-37 threonylcarbamoyl transferase component Bud32
LNGNKESKKMTLEDILQDIHVMEQDLQSYERKYGVLSETFYESYMNGEEPEDEAWVRDWSAWAGAYEIWLRRREQYRTAIRALHTQELPLSKLIERTARREPIPVVV